jgi:phenylacetate-CoA ligase
VVVDGAGTERRAALRERQERLFQRMIGLCASAHPHYKRVFAEHGISPDALRTLDDLSRLPLTQKAELLANPEDFRLQLESIEQLSLEERVTHDLVYTAGTTNEPAPFYFTTYDHFSRLAQLRETCEIAGLTPDDLIANLFPLSRLPHAGFQSALWGACSVGAKMVAGLSGPRHAAYPVQNSLDDVVTLIERQRATVLWGIGTYLRQVVLRAQERGSNLSKIRTLLMMGEACPDGMRADVQARLADLGASRVQVLNGYGFTELQGPAIECAPGAGFHVSAAANYHLQILDPGTNQPMPEGIEGLLVLTHLDRRGTVLLRYVVGDCVALSNEPCPSCGRCGPRFVTSPYRVDQLVRVKGTLINPARIQEELSNLQQHGLIEYQIAVVNGSASDPYAPAQLVVRVACEPSDEARLATEIAARVLDAIEIRPTIEFAPRQGFERELQQYKFRRFVDERRPVG